ncbi:MAG: DUF5752 family protein [Candidatus Krumholzibacteriia bacterium]
MSAETPQRQPFLLRDCSLIARATGRRAQNLRELRDGLLVIEERIIYYHFWGRLLRPHFDDPEFPNDFASWARHALHDHVLAERLAVVDPSEHATLEDLRQELIDICEDRLDESEMVPWAQQDRQFHFITAEIVVFGTGRVLQDPRELSEVMPLLSRGSIFYHVIDARRRNEQGMDDFRVWLRGFGGRWEELEDSLARVDPFMGTLAELREGLTRACRGLSVTEGRGGAL